MVNADLDESWLRTNEIQEFIDTLEFCAKISLLVEDDRAVWKWLLIAIHNGMQAACICSLRGADTAGISILEKSSAKEMWHWLDVESRQAEHGPPPKEKLANFLDLYRRVGNRRCLTHPVPRNSARDREIRLLNELRNDFIHFLPKALSLQLAGLPDIVKSACVVIRHLAVDYPTFSHHFNSDEALRIDGALKNIGVALAGSAF